MKEQLYTIPVSDALDVDCECPLCYMYKSLEDRAVEYVMGPSYMEDDIRAQTDAAGFCEKHLGMMYDSQNLLGLSLILSTHMDTIIKNVKKLGSEARPVSRFKKTAGSSLKSYIDSLESSCFICSRVHHTFDRYIVTIFYLYKHEKDFHNKLFSCKGFCTRHFGLLYSRAPEYLKGDSLQTFTDTLLKLYMDNMLRVREDLEWFKDKFDYRYANEPWKNSEDALPRTMTKIKSILP